MSKLTAQTIGPYRVLEKIGVGGMGMVYKAYQASMNRYVAIKILPHYLSQDPGFRTSFSREIQIIARLEHRYILPVYDAGEDAGSPYFVMRYVEGGTLRDLLMCAPLAPAHAVRLIAQIVEALAYAHKEGVVHRDIKPANVLLDRDGNVLLADFGIAKILQETTHLSSLGAFTGTPLYMAPEQLQSRSVDGRTDLYALGIVLYECLTGRHPYEADTPMAVALMHLYNPLPQSRQINPAISEALERIILKAAAKEPAERFQTADDMLAALDEALISERDTVVPRKMSPRMVAPQADGIRLPGPQRHDSRHTPWIVVIVALIVLSGIWWGGYALLFAPNKGTPLAADGSASSTSRSSETSQFPPVTSPPSTSLGTGVEPAATITVLRKEFELSFDVYAERPWQSTGVEIEPNDIVEITYKSGNWTENIRDTPRSGPEGVKPADNYDCGMPIPHSDTGYNALIAKIGQHEPFKVGSEFKGQPKAEGVLYLRMNDCDNSLDDNTGIVSVIVKILR